MVVDFVIERETEKAYLAQVRTGYCQNTQREKWIPKKCCVTQCYVATVNLITGQPKSYGKRIVEIKDWFARKYL